MERKPRKGNSGGTKGNSIKWIASDDISGYRRIALIMIISASPRDSFASVTKFSCAATRVFSGEPQ
jgi:hypothetical protein